HRGAPGSRRGPIQDRAGHTLMDDSGQGSGKPKMKDIAEVAGVSMATVSLVLNGKPGISEATRGRVLDASRELGYDVGRRLHETPETISVLIEHLPTSPTSDPFNRFVLASVEAEARRA